MPQIPNDLTPHQQMWMTLALVDDGYQWGQIVAAMSPPYQMDKIEGWLIDADVGGAMGEGGEGAGGAPFEAIEPDHVSLVYRQARNQHGDDPEETANIKV